MSIIPKMPEPKTYELEYKYWPWGRLLKKALDWVKANAPQSAFVLDYMCGTGFLLNNISHTRPDLKLAGCSLTSSYIKYANQAYPHLDIALHDAMKYKPRAQPSVIMCMGGIHHLNRKKQFLFIKKTASELERNGYLLLGEETIAEYRTEKERRSAVLKLSCLLLTRLIKAKAPEKVVEAAIDVLRNDLFERGEYKISIAKLIKMLQSHFVIKDANHIWPKEPDNFGDFLVICCRK